MTKSRTPPQVKAAGYTSIRQLALALLHDHPVEFGRDEEEKGSPNSLQMNLSNLFKRRELVWWRNRCNLAVLVAQKLDVPLSTLRLDVEEVQHQFVFDAFPELPPLDLGREERYSIATATLVMDGQGRAPTWKNLDYWLRGDGSIPSPQLLDWLHIEDPTEFKLITTHLAATSRHSVVSMERMGQAGGAVSEALRHHSPLILCVAGKIEARELQNLRARAQHAPLLVISPNALPDSDSNGESRIEKEGSRPRLENRWRWTLSDNWRARLAHWVEQRVAAKNLRAEFRAKSLIDWLATVDPEQRWFPEVADVLGICRIAFNGPPDALEYIARYRNSELIFPFSPRQLALFEDAVLKRWQTWGQRWDMEFTRQDWVAIGVSVRSLDSLLRAKVLAGGSIGYRFADRVLSRLVLRKAIDHMIRNEAPEKWWPACFDNERRPLLDATLGAMQMAALESAASKLSDKLENKVYLIGPAEALLVAIGRQLAREKSLKPGMDKMGAALLSRLEANQMAPFSRPVTTTNQRYEWRSALWAWNISALQERNLKGQWRLPDIVGGVVDQAAEWLNPRPGLHDHKRTVPQGATLDYFMDVTCRWSTSLCAPPADTIAVLLRPAMVQRATAQDWPLAVEWWSGVIGEDWAERSLVKMLDRMEPLPPHAVQRLWQSLVDWQRKVHVERFKNNDSGKDLLLPSCRAEDQKYSPVMQWVADRLTDAQVWRGLNEKNRRFVEEHPQWLLTQHKLVIMQILANRKRPQMAQWQAWNFFSSFLPDAAAGLRYFLTDTDLGREAARGMWNWVPAEALSILRCEREPEASAASTLVLECPTVHLAAALQTLDRRPGLLTQYERQFWIQHHLPSSGPLARELLLLLKFA